MEYGCEPTENQIHDSSGTDLSAPPVATHWSPWTQSFLFDLNAWCIVSSIRPQRLSQQGSPPSGEWGWRRQAGWKPSGSDLSPIHNPPRPLGSQPPSITLPVPLGSCLLGKTGPQGPLLWAPTVRSTFDKKYFQADPWNTNPENINSHAVSIPF